MYLKFFVNIPDMITHCVKAYAYRIRNYLIAVAFSQICQDFQLPFAQITLRIRGSADIIIKFYHAENIFEFWDR